MARARAWTDLGAALLIAAVALTALTACGEGADGGTAAESPVWREVAATYGTTCAVDGAGAVLCASTYTRVPLTRPTPVLTGDRFTSPVAAGASVCALDPEGLLHCRALDGRAYPLADDGIAFRQLGGTRTRGAAWRPTGRPTAGGRTRRPTTRGGGTRRA